jgi:2-polyprenyl-6-methoxyphenol hydroxylase-like FAD-dependent oxidoreductase
MRTDYGCIFGISKPTGDIKESEVHLTHKKGVSLAVMAGLGDRPFWFCFFKLPKTHRGITLPKFTKEDEVRIAENERNTPVTTKVTFGQLYDNVETSTTTPLPDHVFKQWHFGRIILLGDSVHKVRSV